MFRKALNLSYNRFCFNCFLTKRCFSSQIVKTNENLIKNSEKSEKNVENIENIEKSIAEKGLEKSIKTDKQMDEIWELNNHYYEEKEHNKFTDPAFQFHRPLRTRIQVVFFQDWELYLEGIKKRLKLWIKHREQNTQRYVAKRHGNLGPELAIANFVVERGGRVKFRHFPNEWATSLGHFPNEYDKRYEVISVDASNLKLRFEAIDNFVSLYSLESLDLSKNKLDDWSCDKIGRLFRNSNLSSLDLSDNPLITNRGIETLHRIRSLKTLKIKGTEAANYPFLELLTLCFNDLVPECQIIA